ncbi:MAG TPA: winged helix-turn-helix domain-containing protein [Methanomassiliicoccales archaeon]|nr:winged helix-turn-helix domain-containing protein [Methanomassiliicoccales archaeon]
MADEDALMQKLDDLRRSMEEFNASLNRVRYDDYKKALYGQMRELFGENSSFLIDDSRRRIVESSACVNKTECMKNLDEVRDETLAAFQREDVGGAGIVLEDSEAHYSGRQSPCRDRSCSKATIEMLHELKALISVSDNLMFRNYIRPETNFARLSSQGRFFADHRRTYSPELPAKETADLIAPLSNHYRVEILKMLAKEEMSFTNISRALSLKTGHLQFHLKQLREAEYIRGNRKRRSYSITAKGLAALDGLHRFVDGIGIGVKPGN